MDCRALQPITSFRDLRTKVVRSILAAPVTKNKQKKQINYTNDNLINVPLHTTIECYNAKGMSFLRRGHNSECKQS